WIFSTSDAPLSAEVIRRIVMRAMEDPPDLTATPANASVEAGEMPVIVISAKDAKLITRDDSGRKVQIGPHLEPALYHVEVAAGHQLRSHRSLDRLVAH